MHCMNLLPLTGTTGPRKVLFIHRGALGDFVLAFPLLESLKQVGCSITICSHESHGELARALGLCETWFGCETGKGSSMLLGNSESLALCLKGVDCIIAAVADPGNSFRLFLKSHAAVPSFVFFPRPGGSDRIHAADYFFLQLEKLNLAVPGFRDLWQGGEKIVIHPGSGSKKKNWALNNFIGLYEKLGSEKCLYLLGPVEIEQGMNPAGATVKPQSLTDLADVLIHSRGLVSNDSGVAHLAGYLGVPVMAIFQATDPAVWAPRGKRVTVVDLTPERI